MKQSIVAGALALLAACAGCEGSKGEPTERAPWPSASARAPEVTAAPPVSASAPLPYPTAGAATPDEIYARHLDGARDQIKEWHCTPNKPVELRPRASLVTFRCPDNTPNFAFDMAMSAGFLLVSARGDDNVGRGVVEMDFRKTPRGGLTHPVRDGKTIAVVVSYSFLRVIAVPDGYRFGSSGEATDAFELVDEAWVQAAGPHHAERGEIVGRDPVPVFPFEAPGALISFCAAASPSCSGGRHEDRPVVELLETWDGKGYATDLLELAPAYRARLAGVRPFVDALAGSIAAPAAPSASASASAALAASASAAPAASASAAPADSASAAPATGGPRNPYASLDLPDCPWGRLRAAAEALVFARILGDGPDRALDAYDKVMTTMPASACHARSTNLPPWPRLREALLKLPEKPLSRSRAKP